MFIARKEHRNKELRHSGMGEGEMKKEREEVRGLPSGRFDPWENA